jgi:hypothetical protein
VKESSEMEQKKICDMKSQVGDWVNEDVKNYIRQEVEKQVRVAFDKFMDDKFMDQPLRFNSTTLPIAPIKDGKTYSPEQEEAIFNVIKKNRANLAKDPITEFGKKLEKVADKYHDMENQRFKKLAKKIADRELGRVGATELNENEERYIVRFKNDPDDLRIVTRLQLDCIRGSYEAIGITQKDFEFACADSGSHIKLWDYYDKDIGWEKEQWVDYVDQVRNNPDPVVSKQEAEGCDCGSPHCTPTYRSAANCWKGLR